MAELLSLHERGLNNFSKLIANVRSDQWTDPTPCSEWNVHDLVNHIVYENVWVPPLFEGKTIAEVGDQYDGDLLGDDPQGAWENASSVARATVNAPGAMDAICHLSYGDLPGSSYLRDLTLDLIIHGWDLAKATGQDTTIDPESLQWADETVQPSLESFQSSGYFGTPQAGVSSDDQQTRLLAQLGRNA